MKKLRYKVDNKLRGAYGEFDPQKHIIRINKKAHKSKSFKRLTPNKDGTENMLTTLVHEGMHAAHPNMREKSVEKLAKAMKGQMSSKQKKRLYSKI